VIGGGGTDGSVTVNGGAGSNSLILDDQNNVAASSWSVTGTTVKRSHGLGGLVLGSVSAVINYSNVANLTLNGGKANTTFTLSPTAQDLDELPHSSFSGVIGGGGTQGSVTLNGGSGSNSLILDDQNNTAVSSWDVTGKSVTRSHRLGVPLVGSVTAVINYSNVANLTLNGGKANTTFTLSPTAQDLDELPHSSFSGVIGGGGTDGSVTVNGGAGSNSLILDDQNNAAASSWSVTGTTVKRSHGLGGSLLGNVTAVINYSNVANLTLNGGKGNTTFEVSGTPSGQVTINGGTGSNQLTTNNDNHTITITGHNAGNYANVSFVNIGSLAGGSGVDVFKLDPPGQLDGKIDGGGAPAGQGDWLDYSARTTAVTVNLATGAATSVAGGVSNIQNIIGSAGNDTLSGNSLGNILLGGAGNNLLSGGGGRSLLIGGQGNSTIVGGTGDDILIAGTTTFDNNTNALMSILKEWQRTDKTYAQRISDLRSGGGFNGSNKLILGSTVLDNDGASTLTGGGGLNWFFANLAGGVKDTITDLNKATEQVN
jgi:Ca2+-binding RTX toxin-like protein